MNFTDTLFSYKAVVPNNAKQLFGKKLRPPVTK